MNEDNQDDLRTTKFNIQAQNSLLKESVTQLENRVTDLDQYHRRVNLEFVGIPETEGENVKKIVVEVAKHADPNLAEQDVDVTHRLGPKKEKGGPPRPIIVRFTTRRARDAVYNGRKNLRGKTKNQRVFINENLLPATRQLLAKANVERKKADHRYLWTSNARILVRKNSDSPAIVICCEEDLQKIK
ncbi:uncharacterized protein [Diadema setosum]|uniref:uncharacterized protein n=1 Tax=Diadema setosum TaxID=31175 RepID=UPI003B3B583F